MATAIETQPPLYLETPSHSRTQMIHKIQQLPDSLIKEVNDFIDFIFVRQDQKCWEQWNHFHEILALSESDFSDYLGNLETYEERLARGEIQW